MSGEASNVPQFFAGRSVLITGATGFMGKVLVERLLSTCPDVGALFLLVRAKRDALPEKRLKDLKECSVFDELRKSDPTQLDKLRVVAGDTSAPELALSDEDFAQLQDVSVVFNCAATVMFNEPLRRAVELNVLSVSRMLELADRLENIVSFVHVSTAYANAEHEHVEERVYPAPRDLSALVREALATPDHASASEVNRIISPKPNTYTYTKALGEVVVQQHVSRYPIAIFRPSIVVSSIRHPTPGWLANAAGLSGVLLCASAGAMRVFPARGCARADLLPVDLAIDTLIAVAWETAVDKPPSVKVYNCATGRNPVTWTQVRDVGQRYARAHGPKDALLYPNCRLVSNWPLYRFLVLLLQTVPLHLAEHARSLFSLVSKNKENKLSLIKLSDRMLTASQYLAFFTCNQWHFDTHNTRRLCARLSPADAKTYNLDPHSIQWDQFLWDFVRGCRVHLGGDREEDQPAAKRHMRRLYLVHIVMKLLPPLVLARLFYGAAHSAVTWFTTKLREDGVSVPSY